ncbi:MAG: MBL fold metallo-hydrolase [Bacillota bacterium]|nr:MBL fold metallo-hydrolase [Bacillota bacterium]
MCHSLFRIYRFVSGDEDDYLCRAMVFVADRPGSLATLAGVFGGHGVNITSFYYNRSAHPNRVMIQGRSDNLRALQEACRDLNEQGMFDGEAHTTSPELGVLDTRNILKIRVSLQPRPGTLADFAALLRDHKANVIHMAYDEAVCETAATVTLITENAREIGELLQDLNEHGYYYGLHYQGAEREETENIIGLNLVERFFFKLKRLLGGEDTERLKGVVESSRRMSEALTRFSREAGKDLEAGEVFTNVLVFASASLSRTGSAFSYRRLPALPLGGVVFHAFRLPTGGNIHLLESAEEIVMVDGGYGVYYEDVKRMLRENGLDPARVSRIYLGHADADHAGMSGCFAAEFGSRVFLHPAARGVLENENRAWGSGSPLTELNHYFTVLVNTFTKYRVPDDWSAYDTGEHGLLGGFRVIDAFTVGGETFQVLESAGGHVPGQVFFVGTGAGLVFTGDYLLLVESLRPEEREFLNLPKFMMTSTNTDSLLFRREMQALKEVALGLDAALSKQNRGAIVAPGHGDHYPARWLSR